ncbi:DUF2164 domain-containing protein [Cohaesibacter sp. CAU 1516]|uniref:DUF2164 domain-containing protein n=1 Tax=Cohaesibacter sp. CAU 1516 TaxID=2576038 RepID=UPI0010FDC9E0|nr:DUF2164 domain-containing protein [Cohaesibacter sp. CAU 1516]TLP48341.1 DUF2164 domain-containing protein [Cohaesibacter sp. CAU 1516]
MTEVTLTPEEKAHLVELLSAYVAEELDFELGRFEAEFLLDHLARYMAPVFYNRGLLDARALLEKKMDDYTEALYALEQKPGPR